jgi:Arylsulfatase regulator (Fe-S oxidoreductase)
MVGPLNNMYMTSEDFMEWQNYISRLITAEKIKNGDKNTNQKANMPMHVTFVNTQKCNLNCTYCYETHKTNDSMSKKIAKDTIDFLFDKDKINGYYDVDNVPAIILEFIGGEPLLEIDLMNYAVEYFKFKAFQLDHPWSKNYIISFTSNGILFNDPRVQEFLNRNKEKVSVTITIDGNKELHDKCRVFPDGSGSYDIVKKSVETWVKNYDLPCTKITLCPDNIMHLNEAVRNVWEIGVVGAYTNCVYEPVWTTDDAKIMYDQMIKLSDYLLETGNYDKYFCSLFDESIGIPNDTLNNWCGGNGQMLAIGPDGRCFPCIRFMKYSLCNVEEQCIGNIYDGLDNKSENKWLCKLCDINMVSQCQFEDNKKCLTCEISKGCSLCTAFNYDHFGDPNHRATYICSTHKARVLANVYYWNKLYKKLNIDKKFKCNISRNNALEIIDENEYARLLKLAE